MPVRSNSHNCSSRRSRPGNALLFMCFCFYLLPNLTFLLNDHQFIEEAERSLHDAIMIVRRALKNSTVVPGGGAIDV